MRGTAGFVGAFLIVAASTPLFLNAVLPKSGPEAVPADKATVAVEAKEPVPANAKYLGEIKGVELYVYAPTPFIKCFLADPGLTRQELECVETGADPQPVVLEEP